MTRVRGIVNGTTNYILTAMADDDGALRRTSRSRRPSDAATPRPTRPATSRATTRSTSWSSSSASRSAPGSTPPTSPRRRRRATGRPARDHGRRRGRRARVRAARAGTRSSSSRRRPRRGDGVAACVLPTVVPARLAARPDDGVTQPDRDPGRAPGGRWRPGAGGGTSSAVLGDLLAVARGTVDLGGLLRRTCDRPIASASATASPWWSATVPACATVRSATGRRSPGRRRAWPSARTDRPGSGVPRRPRSGRELT